MWYTILPAAVATYGMLHIGLNLFGPMSWLDTGRVIFYMLSVFILVPPRHVMYFQAHRRGITYPLQSYFGMRDQRLTGYIYSPLVCKLYISKCQYDQCSVFIFQKNGEP